MITLARAMHVQTQKRINERGWQGGMIESGAANAGLFSGVGGELIFCAQVVLVRDPVN